MLNNLNSKYTNDYYTKYTNNLILTKDDKYINLNMLTFKIAVVKGKKTNK